MAAAADSDFLLQPRYDWPSRGAIIRVYVPTTAWDWLQSNFTQTCKKLRFTRIPVCTYNPLKEFKKRGRQPACFCKKGWVSWKCYVLTYVTQVMSFLFSAVKLPGWMNLIQFRTVDRRILFYSEVSEDGFKMPREIYGRVGGGKGLYCINISVASTSDTPPPHRGRKGKVPFWSRRFQ